MSEEHKSFWARLFSGSYRSIREEKVLEYILYRVNDGANLRDIVQEEYVSRNASPEEVEEIISNPKLVEAARERMQQEFSSGELDPSQRPQ